MTTTAIGPACALPTTDTAVGQDELWERAIRSLGVEPSAIAPAPGIH